MDAFWVTVPLRHVPGERKAKGKECDRE